jgi:surface protein
MTEMFKEAEYTGSNGSILKWDVSSVVNMRSMFEYTNFSGDLSDWDVSNVIDMSSMFNGSVFNNNLIVSLGIHPTSTFFSCCCDASMSPRAPSVERIRS